MIDCTFSYVKDGDDSNYPCKCKLPSMDDHVIHKCICGREWEDNGTLVLDNYVPTYRPALRFSELPK